jgi:ribonucleoside-diphosphate reductase alpha chain
VYLVSSERWLEIAKDNKETKKKCISQVRKRDGSIVPFDSEKVVEAIFHAAQSVGGNDRKKAEIIAESVIESMNSTFHHKSIPSVEQISDLVEKVLIEENHVKTAKAFIIYRQKHRELRERKSAILGEFIDTDLSENALRVLKERYLLKDKTGKLKETPEELFRRISENIALADAFYGKKTKDVGEVSEEFYTMMSKLEFLPNSPTLMNAGTDIQQLSACFVLPVGDSMEEIFDSIKYTALIHKSGGGTGFSFSRLRPKNDLVMSTKGVASGPISFMKVFDAATNVVKQGGKRRGANMGVLRVDHPDILEFISCKEKNDQLNNFNISVGLTEKFMKAVIANKDYDLLMPKDKRVVRTLNARQVFDLVVTMAWNNGEPGMLFLDRINKDNPTPRVGEIESTNPCGEQPLLPFEACNLGSINLGKFVKSGKVNWDHLREITRSAIHFLDNVIDMNKYPLPQIDEMVKANRKVGLGVMGWADMLVQLGLPYNSEAGVKMGEKVMKFINDEAKKMSQELAKKRGAFPNFKKSIFADKGEPKIRNATRTTIAPTGTLSMIGEASGGVEPNFSICFMKRVMDAQELLYVNKFFERATKEKGVYSEDLMRKIANKDTIQNIEELPEEIRSSFVVAHDIAPEWHIRMQAAFQKHCDNAVSKTVNFPNSATVKEVEEVYMLAYKLGCKGVTIYRDGSRDNQVLNIEHVKKKDKKVPDAKKTVTKKTVAKKEEPKKIITLAKKSNKSACPECGGKMNQSEGCASCPACGYSFCS